MSNPIFLAGMAIIVTALLALVFFGDSGSVAGLPTDQFAQLAPLLAIGLLVGAGVLRRFQFGQYRLWHVAFWLGIVAALMAIYPYVPHR